MLTRVEIDGFKTFDHFELDLPAFLAVLGRNAAGKSNLLDALELLSRLATHGVREAFAGVRGAPDEVFRLQPDGSHGRRMSFAVEVLLDPRVRDRWGEEVELRQTRLRYDLALEGVAVVLAEESGGYGP